MFTATRTVAGPGPAPFIADFTAAASFAEITTTGIFGSVGASLRIDALGIGCGGHARRQRIAVPEPAQFRVAALQHVAAAPVALRPHRSLQLAIVRRIAVED